MHLESSEKAMLGGWDLAKGASFQKLGSNRILIQLAHVVEKKRVIWKGPWAFDKNLVVLSPVPTGSDPMVVPLDKCDFDVHVSVLPFGFMNKKVADYMGNALGSLVYYDEEANRKPGGSVLRIRVANDITKPLTRVMSL